MNKLMSIQDAELFLQEARTPYERVCAKNALTALREVERLRGALRMFGGNKERLIDELYDKDCLLCGFNGKKVDDYVNATLDSCKHTEAEQRFIAVELYDDGIWYNGEKIYTGDTKKLTASEKEAVIESHLTKPSLTDK